MLDNHEALYFPTSRLRVDPLFFQILRKRAFTRTGMSGSKGDLPLLETNLYNVLNYLAQKTPPAE